MKPEDDFEAERQEYNAWLRRHSNEFADSLDDAATRQDGTPVTSVPKEAEMKETKAAYFEGQVLGISVFPFKMRAWERRIWWRSYPLLHLDTASIDGLYGDPVSHWEDSSGTLNDKLLPRWFRLWLRFRRFIARIRE